MSPWSAFAMEPPVHDAEHVQVYGPESVQLASSANPKIIVMLLIFFVSLFGSSQLHPYQLPLDSLPIATPHSAVSFPALSIRFQFLRLPRILFFIGKNFGTGVILSTAFVHLLQDAFESLLDLQVHQRWPQVGSWAGRIMYVLLHVRVFCVLFFFPWETIVLILPELHIDHTFLLGRFTFLLTFAANISLDN
jgi:hypothetical protein